MKLFKISFVIILILSQSNLYSQLSYKQNFVVESDPRVELMSIIFMLAGNPEYSQCQLPEYKKDVLKYFDKYKEHEAVKLAQENRNKNGVSYDAVMSMAVHLKDAFTVELNLPLSQNPEKLDKRWKPDNAQKFLEALKDFVSKSDFRKFITEHAEFYKETDKRLTRIINRYAKLSWYESFFGRKSSGQFILVPGYLTGGGNYGVSFKDDGNRIDQMYSVTAIPKVDSMGVPLFDPQMIPTVIHEFCHSYVNPVVYKHINELKEAGEKIFPFVSKKMYEQAYGTWSTMMIESVVRACVNRYLIRNSNEAAVKNDIQYNIGRGFIWMDDFTKLFDEFENNRNSYIGLDEFFPKIVKFFNDYSLIIKDKIDAIEKEKEARFAEMREKGPKIVAIQPANGDEKVDPNTDIIIITFDREMKDLSWAFNRGNGTFPTVDGKPAYENGNKVLKLKVKLIPNTVYEFWLNSETNLGFKSADNMPLVPTLIKFKTK